MIKPNKKRTYVTQGRGWSIATKRKFAKTYHDLKEQVGRHVSATFDIGGGNKSPYINWTASACDKDKITLDALINVKVPMEHITFKIEDNIKND